MLFAATIAVEQEVTVDAITIAFFYLHVSDMHRHTFHRSRAETLLYNLDTDSWSRSTKLAHI